MSAGKGSSAFPHEARNETRPGGDWGETSVHIPAQSGMTLRDYFAAKAIPTMIYKAENNDSGWDHVAVAVGCYQLADAMLAERALTHPPIRESGTRPIGDSGGLSPQSGSTAPVGRDFLELIARMLLDGEDDGSGEKTAFEQSDDDARETLANLITTARELTGIEGPGKPVCNNFQSDGRGRCRHCDHVHGPEGAQ